MENCASKQIRPLKLTFENHENMDMGADILCLAVCICDVMSMAESRAKLVKLFIGKNEPM